MALINCRECKSQMSDSVKNCPKCGHPKQNIKSGFSSIITTTVITISLIVIFFLIISQFNNESNKLENPTYDNTLYEPTDTSAVSEGTVNVKKLSTQERKDNVEKLRNMFLDTGIDVEVSVYGKNNEILELKYALFNDVWFRKFETSGMFDNFHKLGYKKIILNDNYEYKKYISY